MHQSVMAWFPRVLAAAEVRGRRVLEVGAQNVNGSVRSYVESLRPAEYIGVDQERGVGVDQVVSAVQIVEHFGACSFDVVVSTEMLEHAEDWRSCLTQMAQVLRVGGLLLLTTRSPGFPYHPFPVDCWRFTPELMRAALQRLGLDSNVVPDTDPQTPGVFVLAARPASAIPLRESLDGLEAEPMGVPA